MRRREFLTLIVGSLAVSSPVAGAQGAAKMVRVGWLTAQREASLAPFLAALRTALADLGYAEGRNISIEYRFGDDQLDRVPALAAELVERKVDLISAQGAAVAVAAKLNLPVPLVYVFSGDPVSAGFADSLARPRGDMTGLTFMAAEFNGKRLELLRDTIPNLRRVAIVANPAHPGEHLERNYTEETAGSSAYRPTISPRARATNSTAPLPPWRRIPPQAISLFADGFAIQYRQSIIDFGLSHRVPVVSGWAVFARSGALFTYGPHLSSSYQRLAYYVDRIVKGARARRPADRAIDQVRADDQPQDGAGARPHVPPTLLATPTR